MLGDHHPMLAAAFSLIQAACLSLPASASTLTKMGSLNKASVRVPPEGLPYLSAFSEGLELSLLLGKPAQLHNLSVAQQTCLGRGGEQGSFKNNFPIKKKSELQCAILWKSQS